MDCVDRCNYNTEYTVRCDDIEIPLLSEIDHSQLFIESEINDNFYRGYINDILVWVKYTGSTLDKEICTQIRASEKELSPKIIGYWKCKNVDFGYIVMESYKSEPKVYNENSVQDKEEFYKQVLMKIAKLNDSGIIHGNIEKNIIYNQGNIMFVNFQDSKDINDQNKYDDLDKFTKSFKGKNVLWKNYDKYGTLFGLVENLTVERDENLVEKKFNCHADDTKLDCSILNLTSDIPQLTQDELNKIKVGNLIGKGLYGKVYDGKLGNKEIALKYFGGKTLNEVCIQQHVSKYKIAAKIQSYWKCKEGNYNLLIMDKINGITLYNYITPENNLYILNILTELIRMVHFMNFKLGIRHNDLHTNNMIFNSDNKSLTLIDFGLSKVIPDISSLDKYYQMSYKEIYNSEIGDEIYPYFSDLAMLSNKIAIVIQKQIPPGKSSNKLVDIITTNNLDDYSGWFRIFKEYKLREKQDLSPDQLKILIKILFEKGISESMPKNIVNKFHLCIPEGSENIKIDCVSNLSNDKVFTKEINQVSVSDLEKIDVLFLKIKDATITLYQGKWGQIPVNVIYMIENAVSMQQQICFHAAASDYSLSPEIIGYWKCPSTNFTLLITQPIPGQRLSEYIKKNPSKDTFLRLVSAILSLNLNLRIINDNITYNNILISDKNINILGYPKARKIEDDVLLDDLSGKRNIITIYKDLIAISNMFKINKKLDNFIIENKLNENAGWRSIYRAFYKKLNKIPESSQVYNYIGTKLQNV